MIRNKYILFCVIIVCLCACNVPSSIREARQTVAQSDSMWRAGQPCDDSIQLAQAYEILDRWQWFYADDYAHACYHYGRLLRQKEDPVSAMQVFINATHSRTRDYHILGRVYSNMGSICHLAGEYPLAYDMYERSANMFLKNGDTISYYYLLNDMAFELADQGKKKETLVLLDNIIMGCSDSDVLCKLNETKAEMYMRVGQYDSAIHYSTLFYEKGDHEFNGLLIKAQAYSFQGEKDSAVYYANLVQSLSQDLFTLNSTLYILTQDDDNKNIEEIRIASADRSDVQKLLEIRRGLLAQAIQLLEQDMQRKPDLTWLYAIILTLAMMGMGSYIYIRHKRKRHKLLSQKIKDLESISRENQHQMQMQIAEKKALMANSLDLAKTIYWNDFEKMCLIFDQQFNMLASKLRGRNILNETEIRLCFLVFLGLNRTRIAVTMPYAINSVGKLKDQTAKLLGTTGKNLQDFLFDMATDRCNTK